MLNKNDTLRVTIVDLNDDGQGIAKVDGEVIFVPNALVGEEVDIVIINAKSKFKIGKVQNRLVSSSERVKPECPYFPACGGCTIMHLNYDAQLSLKRKRVVSALARIGDILFDVDPVVPSERLHYRNKLALPVNEKGEIGLYRTNTHTIVPIDDCLTTLPYARKLIGVLKTYLAQVLVADGTNKHIKHFVARQVGDSLLVCVVTNGKTLPKKEIFVSLITSAFKKVCISQNINELNSNVIFSNNFKLIYGEPAKASAFGVNYTLSSASFAQINDQICARIYGDIVDQINTADVVVDAYSGAGLLSSIMAKKARVVYGIEIIKPATEDADKLKKANAITNLFNINGDCAQKLPELVKKITDPFTVVLDPPRKGADPKVLNAICKSAPRKIIYLSCNPSTLARDLKILLAANYRLTSVTPYDMFPCTSHVETLAILEKI